MFLDLWIVSTLESHYIKIHTYSIIWCQLWVRVQ